MHMCLAKSRLREDKLTNSYAVEQLKLRLVGNLRGVSVASAVVTVGETVRIPLLIVNSTDEIVTFRQRYPRARLNQVGSVNNKRNTITSRRNI